MGILMNRKNEEIEKAKEKEAASKQEGTRDVMTFRPDADIYENQKEIVLLLDMPGVSKDNVDIRIDNNTLSVSGRINVGAWEKLTPVYSEYNVGNYERSFTLSDSIDAEGISAQAENGVLKVVLPKREKAQPRTISVS